MASVFHDQSVCRFVHLFCFFLTSDRRPSNSRERARREKQTLPPPLRMTNLVRRLLSLLTLGHGGRAFGRSSSPREKHHSPTLSIISEAVWKLKQQSHICASVHGWSERCCQRNTLHMPGLSTNPSMSKLSAFMTTMTSSSTQ